MGNHQHRDYPERADDTVVMRQPEMRRPYVDMGGTSDTKEDDGTKVFLDLTEWFGVRIETRTGRTYFSRWFHIDKLPADMDMFENQMAGDIEDGDKEWFSVYVPEGVVYIKRRDIVGVTFFSRDWWDREYGRSVKGYPYSPYSDQRVDGSSGTNPLWSDH
jgi:hypothetical protein